MQDWQKTYQSLSHHVLLDLILCLPNSPPGNQREQMVHPFSRKAELRRMCASGALISFDSTYKDVSWLCSWAKSWQMQEAREKKISHIWGGPGGTHYHKMWGRPLAQTMLKELDKPTGKDRSTNAYEKGWRDIAVQLLLVCISVLLLNTKVVQWLLEKLATLMWP